MASGELAFATTAARSAGTSTVPRGAWPAASVPTRTPSGAVTAYSTAPSSVGVSVSSERSRSTGVNRHSSSRPFGIGNAATSNDVGRSARDWSGTNAATGVGVRVLTRTAGEPGGLLQQRHQPTAPSICSSMSRLSSRAYSMGSSRAMGSTNPRTIIAMASSSVSPRDWR